MGKGSRRNRIPTSMRHEVERVFGTKCWYCGTDQRVELHHIIPVEMGGKDKVHNLLPLCRICHMKAHGKIQRDYSNTGRPRKTDTVQNWEGILRDYLSCKIGTKECKRLLGLSNRTPLSDRSYIREYLKREGIKQYRNNVDLIVQQCRRKGKKIKEGQITGWMEYENGKMEEFSWTLY